MRMWMLISARTIHRPRRYEKPAWDCWTRPVFMGVRRGVNEMGNAGSPDANPVNTRGIPILDHALRKAGRHCGRIGQAARTIDLPPRLEQPQCSIPTAARRPGGRRTDYVWAAYQLRTSSIRR
jgi:hypothetical protein